MLPAHPLSMRLVSSFDRPSCVCCQASLPEAEFEEMRQHPNVWAVDKVFNYLTKLVKVRSSHLPHFPESCQKSLCF